MAVVQLLLELLAGHGDLLGVDDDHEVAGVDVRRVARACACRAACRRSASRDARGSRPSASTTYQRRSTSCGFAFQVFMAGKKSGGPGARRPRSLARGGPSLQRVTGSRCRRPAPARGPRRNAAAPPWDGWRSHGRPSASPATRPTARPDGRRERIEERPPRRDLGPGGRAVRSPAGQVGADEPARRSRAAPRRRASELASTRWTIVAVASAGPCRSAGARR